MRQLFLSFIVLALAFSASAQNRKVNEFVTDSGDTLRVGGMIKVGQGTKPDGKYKYIIGLFDLSPTFAGFKFEIRKIKLLGNEKMGWQHELTIHPGVGAVTYMVSFENALKVGEIEIIKP